MPRSGIAEIEASGQWEQMPADVPPPEECEQRRHVSEMSASINDRLEERMVKARSFEGLDGSEPGDGQTLLWARLPDVITGVDATTLAILGDFVPMGIGQALGRGPVATASTTRCGCAGWCRPSGC